MLASKALAAAVSQEPAYIEDVFSTYLYMGNGSTQTITNGIDLAGKGGLVWIKRRDAADHFLGDTQRGSNKILKTNSTAAQVDTSGNPSITGFTSSGFTLGVNSDVNGSGATPGLVSWTFRKQAKFFDVVTYTGNGSNRTISHNLGSVPGCIIVKRTDTTADWQVYHRSIANTEYLVLNTTAAKATGTTRWNSTTPTSTVFSLGTDTTVNASGGTYVAYIFAHDAGGFGLSGSDNVISCGSFTTSGGAATVALGYEPQFVITKRTDSADNWALGDTSRGLTQSQIARLIPNLSNAEDLITSYVTTPTATGFDAKGFTSTATYIYIAIRRGPMKVPTSGTSVFKPIAYDGLSPGSGNASLTSQFPIDLIWARVRNFTSNFGVSQSSTGVLTRLTGGLTASSAFTNTLIMATSSTSDEQDQTTGIFGASNTGFLINGDSGVLNSLAQDSGAGEKYIAECFRRAPGFFDVVCDTGTGSAHTVSHNLGATPELMIRKKRSAADNWVVYAGDATDYLILNSTAATADLDTMWNDTAPTTSVFTVGTNDDVNQSTGTFVTYLFATLAGVSKVGSYTGSGTTKQIDCGFTAGARFVLIKRTDSTGDWYVWDTARGIVAGNDPYLLLNSTAAEVTSTDYVDSYSAGFELSSTAPAAINANGGTYIFLAIA